MTDDDRIPPFSPDPTPWAADRLESQATGNDDWHGIGEVSREYGVTERALRFYEAKGLLAPSHDGAARRYGAKERDRLAMLLKAKTLGFTLAKIGRMFATQSGNGVLDIGRRQCVEQIRLLEQRKREIETALAELRRSYSSLYTRLAACGG